MDTPPNRVLIQPDSAHTRFTIPQAPSEQRHVHVPEVSVTQMHAGNGRAFRSLTARGGGFVLDLVMSLFPSPQCSGSKLIGPTRLRADGPSGRTRRTGGPSPRRALGEAR